MSHWKEDRQGDGARPSRNDTVTAQGENQAPRAREPFEHDESADSQAADSPDIEAMGQVAHDAAVSPQQDTSKAQETDATYHRMRQDAGPAPLEKPDPSRRGG